MLNLVGFEDILNLLPLILFPLIIFAVIIVVVVSVAVSRSKAQKRHKETMDEYKAQHQYYTDGNGRTEHQRDYLNSKRRELAERKISSADGSHEHTGRVEKYDKIVGSLGEVDDEGCDELDGVRLIEHDESYCDDPDHVVKANRDELIRAMVLGEVINAPRFKQPYTRKK